MNNHLLTSSLFIASKNIGKSLAIIKKNKTAYKDVVYDLDEEDTYAGWAERG